MSLFQIKHTVVQISFWNAKDKTTNVNLQFWMVRTPVYHIYRYKNTPLAFIKLHVQCHTYLVTDSYFNGCKISYHPECRLTTPPTVCDTGREMSDEHRQVPIQATFINTPLRNHSCKHPGERHHNDTQNTILPSRKITSKNLLYMFLHRMYTKWRWNWWLRSPCWRWETAGRAESWTSERTCTYNSCNQLSPDTSKTEILEDLESISPNV